MYILDFEIVSVTNFQIRVFFISGVKIIFLLKPRLEFRYILYMITWKGAKDNFKKKGPPQAKKNLLKRRDHFKVTASVLSLMKCVDKTQGRQNISSRQKWSFYSKSLNSTDLRDMSF